MKNRDAKERMLHDYLDGRLSPEEEKRFEASLAREPELARRLETLREMGRALREGEEELSPGFYTRARAAFEEASRERAARRWFRPLSWETAGLVAAVLVAAVLFVPGMLRAPLQREIRPGPEPSLADSATKAEDALAAGAAAEDESERQRLEAEQESVSATGEASAVQASPPESRQLGRGAAPKKAAPAEDRDKEQAGEAPSRWAPAPPPETPADEVPQPAPPAVQKMVTPTDAKSKEQRLAEAEEKYAMADAVRRALPGSSVAEGGATARPAALPLPPGVVEPGAFRVIDDPEEWRVLLAGPAEQALLDLGGYDPGYRLVLIGAREQPLDCSRVSMVTTETAHWILLSPPPEGGHAARDGCAVLVPRDGRTVDLAPVASN